MESGQRVCYAREDDEEACAQKREAQRQHPRRREASVNVPAVPSSSRTSSLLPSLSSTTPLGLVRTTAWARLASTVVWDTPMRSLPCRPRMMYLASLPFARTRRDLILSTFHFWDWEPVTLACIFVALLHGRNEV